MAQYKVAVLGGGAIFSRHLEALKAYPENYQLIGLFDPDPAIISKWHQQLPAIKYYFAENEVYHDSDVNCVVILSPSNLHFIQAKKAITAGKSVIIEKPVAFSPHEVIELEDLAAKHQVGAFCVLQVRLNPSIAIARRILQQNLLGDIRGASLIQRWQRPDNYFSGWRGSYGNCGGVLFEFGIHYLDIMQLLLGKPMVSCANFFKTKFRNAKISDTAYALLNFGNFGGTVEISLSAEPNNIELSLTIMGSNGYLRLSGRSLDQIAAFELADDNLKQTYKDICQDVLGTPIDKQVTIGACPHHPELYRQIICNPQMFMLSSTYPVIELVAAINSLDKLAYDDAV